MRKTVITAPEEGAGQNDASGQSLTTPPPQPVPAPHLTAPRLPLQMPALHDFFSRLPYTPPKMISGVSPNIANDLVIESPPHFAGDGSDCLSGKIAVSVEGSSMINAGMRNVDADLALIVQSISESFLDGRLPPFEVSYSHVSLGQLSLGGHPSSMPVYSYCLDFTDWGSRGCVLPPPSYSQAQMSLGRLNALRDNSSHESQWLVVPLGKLLPANAENGAVDCLDAAGPVPVFAVDEVHALPAQYEADDAVPAGDGRMAPEDALLAGLADQDPATHFLGGA